MSVAVLALHYCPQLMSAAILALHYFPQLMSVAVLALHYCPQLMPSSRAMETGESGPVAAAEAEHTTMQCFIQHGHGE